MKSANNILLIIIPIFLCLITGCKEDASSSKSPPTVIFEHLQAEKIEILRELPGRVSARRMAEVRPQAGGILRERLFEEGDEVAKGQLLYKIDDAPLRAAFNEAKADLARAQSREEAARKHMERCIVLAKQHAVRLQERDDAIAAYKAIEAEINAARELVEKAAIELGYTNIEAPISGRIGRSLVKEGALLSENQTSPMAVINQLDPVYVDVTLPALELIAMKKRQASASAQPRQSADVILNDRDINSNQGAPLQCEIMFSETEADETTGTVVTRLKCDNSERLLLPGMYVKTRLPTQTLDQAIVIPQRSVGRDNRNRPVVYVLKPENGEIYRLEERPVKLRMEHNGNWVIDHGLAAGDLLLVEGLQIARDGLLVKGLPRNSKEK